MLHVALLCLLVGQVPPPPVPHPPESYTESPSDQPPADPQAQREWLLSHLTADLQSQGKDDAQKQSEIETMLKNVTDEQLTHAIQYYQRRKAAQLAEAEANLHRLEAYRDQLKLEVERRQQTYQQQQAITAYAWTRRDKSLFLGKLGEPTEMSRWSPGFSRHCR